MYKSRHRGLYFGRQKDGDREDVVRNAHKFPLKFFEMNGMIESEIFVKSLKKTLEIWVLVLYYN